jgi:hypothetical protein
MEFQEAVAKLENLGIKGTHIYLIDLLPLIDLMWADGVIQDNEKVIFEVYTQKRIDVINKSFDGAFRLTQKSVEEFFAPFLKKRPDSIMMTAIGDILNAVLMSSSDEQWSDQLRNSLLAAALDIASSNVSKYPYENNERFSLQEKQCFFSLVKNLG